MSRITGQKNLSSLCSSRSAGLVKAAVLLLLIISPTETWAQESAFANLKSRLITDGFEPEVVQSIYQHPRVRLEVKLVAGNLVRREATLNYNQFLSADAVAKCGRYLQHHYQALQRTEKRFGVAPEVVVAILMVETALGTYTGKHLSINVLSTMAAAQERRVREQILASLSAAQRKIRSRQEVSKRLKVRANRGYRELKAFIRYVYNHDLDIFSLHGSSEGAIGIPQFLPSNIDRYGRDGNGDGRVNLFDHEDAMASVASFLTAHHWQGAKGAEEKKRVLLHYNRSIYYADTVYALAHRLEQKIDKPMPAR
jgi:membrane-bound lytic murein transglycosylase B